MGTGRSSTGSGPVALSALFDAAEQRLPKPRKEIPPGDGFIFSGNRHETVPRALLLDRRLTPLERNAWQVFRLKLNDDGVTAFPTYQELRPYLASTPCDSLASHETVARALTLLRLTRWLSLVRRRRDPKTGRHLGNLYVLHDEPLTPYEAVQLDPEYFGLISQALDHASKAIQRVGQHTVKEIAEDPMLKGRLLPTRLQVLTQRLANGSDPLKSYPQEERIHDSEEGSNARLRNRDDLTSESEAGRQPAENQALRIPKTDSTSTTNTSIKEVQVLRAHTREPELKLPACFFELLSEHQQLSIQVTLRQLDSGELQQSVLDEWAACCKKGTVKKPAGHLWGTIQKAIRGEFKPWASLAEPVAASPPARAAPAPPPHQPTGPEEAKVHLADLLARVKKFRR